MTDEKSLMVTDIVEKGRDKVKEQAAVAVSVDVECVFLSEVIFFTIDDIPLAIPIDKVDIRPNCQDWLTENLPPTNPPASTRPGAVYGVDV